MIDSFMRNHSVGSNRDFMKAGHRQLATSSVLVLVLVFALIPIGHGFRAEWPLPPSGQPAQMSSRVDYDPKLTDPFFKSNEWSYPDYNLEGIPLDKRPKKPPRLRHTAKCFSTSLGIEHLVRFCEARLLDVNMIDLFIHEDSASFFDQLTIRITNGMFTCQYWTAYEAPGQADWIWTTIRQELTLDKKTYRKGDVIKGRIDFECLSELIQPMPPSPPQKIRLIGVFKTILE